MNIAIWVVSVLLFGLYEFAGLPKLMGAQQVVDGFRSWGFSDGFRLFIGACESLGGIALLVPRLAFWSACGLVVIMIGAIHTVVTHDMVTQAPFPAVALLLLLFVIYVRRRQALLLS
ncbi:MAG TPA: DoxX family protein [Myxococcota bacterium]|nr:DoxX family protein [Myxococcota bacterium]